MPRTFLTRQDAAQYLRDQGVPMGTNTLAKLAADGRGPRFVNINGRALYTVPWLAAWLKAQAKEPSQRGRCRRAQGAV